MAGIATNSSFQLKLYRTTSKTTSSSPAFSSFESKLFGIRVCSPNLIKSISEFSTSTNGPIVSCYSGGSSRYPVKSDSDDEQALDISSIRSDSVRLVDAQQNMVGVVSKNEAVRLAEDAELNLVILSADAEPPVVRIMNYNKYRYEQQKKKRDQQKKSAATRMDLKELKMGYNIDQHDYSVRLKAAQKFLKDGDKVKTVVSLKGRENEFQNIAMELIRRFQNDVGEMLSVCLQNDVGELATEESKNFRDRNMFMVLVPNKAIQQKAQEPPKKKEKINQL